MNGQSPLSRYISIRIFLLDLYNVFNAVYWWRGIMGYVMVGTNTISLFWIVGAYIQNKTKTEGGHVVGYIFNISK